MVDRDILLRKEETVRECVEALRARRGVTAESLAGDRDLRNSVFMDVLQAVQACIDLAAHVCSHEGLGIPRSQGDAFTILAKHGRIDDDLAARLSRASGFRNLLVHRYDDLELERAVEVVDHGLDDLVAFVAAVRGGPTGE